MALGLLLALWMGPLAEPALAPGEDAQRLTLHADSQLHTRRLPASTGTLILVRQTLHGLPVAGARLALRLDEDGKLIAMTGQLLDPSRAVPRSAPTGAELWWPENAGLVPAREQIETLGVEDGAPHQARVYEDLHGRELARESTVYEIGVPLRAWEENPTTTPEPFTQEVNLLDLDPILLQDEQVRAVQCVWDESEQLCGDDDFPTIPAAAFAEGFSEPLPPISDTEAHADPTDALAPIASMLYAAQFSERLASWGWDPQVWDEIDCSWQEVDPDLCRLTIYANARTEEGPLDGAFYTSTGRIFMGQGIHADAGYDMGVLVHEYGHHVTRGFGSPAPIEGPSDLSLLYTDRGAINEGTSDFFADLLTPTDELYVYFRNFGGLYQGVRVRDAGLDFACPQNLVGELHMEGRIWVSTLHDIHAELLDANLSTDEEFGAAFLLALARIRQLPRGTGDQFEPAAGLVAQELGLALGPQAEALALALFDERGLIGCTRSLEIRQEPTFDGTPASEDPLDARFLYLDSYRANTTPSVVDRYPRPPAVQHTLTLAENETGVVLRFVPDRWRTRKRIDAPLDQDGIVVGLLVKELDGSEDSRIEWTQREDETVTPPVTRLVNDADFEFRSELDPDRDGTWFRITVDGLEPGASYALAVVSFNRLSGFDILVDQMEWQPILGEVDAGSADTRLDDGCACQSTPRSTPATFALFALLGLARVRRRKQGTPRRSACGPRTRRRPHPDGFRVPRPRRP